MKRIDPDKPIAERIFEFAPDINEIPEYATDKENYHRVYQRVQRHVNRVTGRSVKDIMTEAKEKGLNPSGNSIKDILEAVRVVYGSYKKEQETFFEKNPGSNKEDLIFNLAEKYLPLAENFISGFITRMQEKKQQQEKTDNSKIVPPEGWVTMSVFEKINYTGTDWYRQGLEYDAYIERQKNNMMQHSMLQIEAEANKIIQEKTPEIIEVTKNSEPNHTLEPARDQGEREKEETQENPGEAEEIETEELINMLQGDNQRYVKFGIEKLNEMPNAEFIEALKNIDCHIKKFLIFKVLIPSQLKSMIKLTPFSDFREIIENECQQKAIIISELEKWDTLAAKYTEVRNQL